MKLQTTGKMSRENGKGERHTARVTTLKRKKDSFLSAAAALTAVDAALISSWVRGSKGCALTPAAQCCCQDVCRRAC